MMNGYLLDTNVLLYAFANPDKLKSKTRRIIENIENDIYLSTVSIWEISIKYDIGKLSLKPTWMVDLENYIQEEQFLRLNIESRHCYHILNLPKMHGDQFDRLLIAQALSEDLTVITTDATFQQYPLSVHLM